ncbi:MAG: hypothetical protein KC492_14535 [Myxococcales bacterium]|nr:hypothetical protein [Myxococcales bacterium]
MKPGPLWFRILCTVVMTVGGVVAWAAVPGAAATIGSLLGLPGLHFSSAMAAAILTAWWVLLPFVFVGSAALGWRTVRRRPEAGV